jgi:hypothetical protein
MQQQQQHTISPLANQIKRAGFMPTDEILQIALVEYLTIANSPAIMPLSWPA